MSGQILRYSILSLSSLIRKGINTKKEKNCIKADTLLVFCKSISYLFCRKYDICSADYSFSFDKKFILLQEEICINEILKQTIYMYNYKKI